MSEMDTLGATPSWIQRELADADYISAVSKKTPNDLEEFTYNGTWLVQKLALVYVLCFEFKQIIASLKCMFITSIA